jgi:hypothetical protein
VAAALATASRASVASLHFLSFAIAALISSEGCV